MEQDIYNGVTVTKSWSFLAFAKENGLPYLREDVNKTTGEVFHSLAFPEAAEGPIFCRMGNSVKDMSIEDIVAQKDSLQVGLNTNGRYTLFKRTKGTLIQLW